MRKEFKLIYVGLLKFGFKSKGEITILGLIDYIEQNKLTLDECPEIHVNRNYIPKSDEWFWILEWCSELINGKRELIVYFDKFGCHYKKYSNINSIEEGILNKYEEFLEQFIWLSGN